jgi:branched-chain amino acid transport system substrate-binding protein
MPKWFRPLVCLAAPLALLLGLVLVNGCKPGGGGGSSTATTGDIVIGHYGSLTGSEATFGLSTSRGVQLAIAEVNAAGGINGRKVVLKEYDDKGDTKETGAVVTRLVTSDKVVAVIGEVASALSLAAAPVCQEYGVPMISPSSTNERVTKVGDKIFRVCFIDAFQGYVGAKFAKENRNATKVAILYDQAAPYSAGLAAEFEKHFKSMGGTITSKQAYNAGTQDFSAQLNSIQSTSPEMIYVPGYYTDVANIAIQARRLGIKAPLLGGDGWDSAKLTEIGGAAIEGSFYSNHASPDDPSPKIQGFIEKYKKAHNETPDALAALGYDAAGVLFEAIKRAGTTDGGPLAKAIAETKGYDGVTGTITIDKDRNAVKPAVVLEVKGGKPTFVARVEPPK